MRGGSGGGVKKRNRMEGGKREREREGRGEEKRGKAQRASEGAKRNGRRHRWMDGMDGWVDEWDAPFPTFPKLQPGAFSLCLFGLGKIVAA